MSVFPDFLYKLTPRDTQVTPLEVYYQTSVLTANAAANTTPIITVPLGKIFIAQMINAVGSPDTLAKLLSIEIATGKGGAGTEFNSFCTKYYSAGAGIADVLNLTGEFYFTEGTNIEVIATFDTAHANNTAYIAMTGILIPRGNFVI